MTELQQISRPISAELQHFSALFDQALSHEDDLTGKILEHVRARKGKMMRPILVLLCAREFGIVNDNTYKMGLSLEIFHNASLLHDDVVDESDERRGMKSVNAKFGNKLAVLIGDYMLSVALEQAVKTEKILVVKRISQLGESLSEGEVRQQANIRDKVISEEAYYDVIRNKTAELFSACSEFGAMSVDAPQADVIKARRLGEIIGMCFQIKDDIFDYYDNTGIGKPTGNDMLEGKLTLPAIHVLKTAPEAHYVEIAQRVKDRNVSAGEIAELVEYVKNNGGIAYAYSVIDTFKQEAYKILDSYKNEEIKAALRAYVDFVVMRNK